MRRGKAQRETGETRVQVDLLLEGRGEYQVDTSHGFFDHLLAQLARHGLFDLSLTARGDPSGLHHLVEDTAIALGRALREAVGEGKGIRRFGHALVPMDEALALVAVDLGGRGSAQVEGEVEGLIEGSFPADLLRHFLETLAREARFTLHARLLAGQNDHHKAEALFKALARALREAVEEDPRLQGEVPSTKGTLG